MTSRLLTTFLFVLLVPIFVLGQKDYKGRIIDAETDKFLPYVNIGIVGKELGTVSDEEGIFHLAIDPNKYTQKDTLVISAMGYTTIKFAIPELVYAYNEYPKLFMRPETFELNEVVVTNKGGFPVEKSVGYQSNGTKVFGYWKENIALGGELATKIRVRKGLRKLDLFSFEVKANPSDSVLVRVNVYDNDGPRGFPNTNLNTSRKDILYTLRKGIGTRTVDLTPYDIYVKDDFTISLELLNVYGVKKINLILAASDNNFAASYRKYASQGFWKKLGTTGMAYSLKTTYYAKKRPKSNKKRSQSYAVSTPTALPNLFFTRSHRTEAKVKVRKRKPNSSSTLAAPLN